MAQLSIHRLLSLPSNERAEFLQQNLNSEGGTLNLDNITGWEDLPDGERDILASQLL